MERTISFVLNGEPVEATVRPFETLLDVLRYRFDLGGARECCDQGLCGTCTVWVSGEPVSSCLYLAPFLDGKEVVTIEGLGSEDQLHPVQEAFYNQGALQCGYCIPGMIMMVARLLEENPDPSLEELQEYLAGNLCRCGSYPQILAAIREAAQKRTALK